MHLRFPKNPINKENLVFLSYDNHRKNMGDILSPLIAEHYGSKEVRRISKKKVGSLNIIL